MADEKAPRRSPRSGQSDPTSSATSNRPPWTTAAVARYAQRDASCGRGRSAARLDHAGWRAAREAEDVQGDPFVGPAGALLDKALEEAGSVRNEVYVTNTVKHFKWTARGKRRMHKTPAQREIEACQYWFEGEIQAAGARVIIALGAPALKALLDDPHARSQDSLGETLEHGVHVTVATYHPSFALRAPDSETRREVYAEIVAALQTAEILTHRCKGHH